LRLDTNRVGEVESLSHRAIDIGESCRGKDHPQVAAWYNNLAQVLYKANRLGEAEPLIRRAFAIVEATLGKDHPEVAICLNNLAQLLQATNRLAEAEPLMRRHLVIFLAFEHATGHPHRDAAIRNFTRLLAAMGKSVAEIDTELAALWREAGLEPG